MDKIAEWIDTVLEQPIPDEVKAFCFNLYDDGDAKWSIELIGASQFCLEDEYWPCEEVTTFETRENPYCFEQDEEWEVILEEVIAALKDYLHNGAKADCLKQKAGVGVGFVDGDVEIIYTA